MDQDRLPVVFAHTSGMGTLDTSQNWTDYSPTQIIFTQGSMR
jgi:hypothetical protein